MSVVSFISSLLGGCDLRHIAELEEGVSTEADVRQRFGEPVAVYDEEGGGHTLEFPRQPEGQRNYMITIGADGKMSALRQVLTPSNFAKVVAGLDRTQVRRLLGRPARVQTFALQPGEVWEWRFLDVNLARVFAVNFDAEGRVASAAAADDPREQGGR